MFEQILPALIGIGGVIVGSVITIIANTRREKNQRRYEFSRLKLEKLYSPLLGIRQEIEVHSSVRRKISANANSIWEQLVQQNYDHTNVDRSVKMQQELQKNR